MDLIGLTKMTAVRRRATARENNDYERSAQQSAHGVKLAKKSVAAQLVSAQKPCTGFK